MAQVQEKVSSCCRAMKYAATYCGISSCLQPIAFQGYNPLTAIQIALNGNATGMLKNKQENPHE